jgi:hypothetical protein
MCNVEVMVEQLQRTLICKELVLCELLSTRIDIAHLIQKPKNHP